MNGPTDATETPPTAVRVVVVVHLPVPVAALTAIIAACDRYFPKATIRNGPDNATLDIVVHEVVSHG